MSSRGAGEPKLRAERGGRSGLPLRYPGLTAALLAGIVYAALGYALSGNPPEALSPPLAALVRVAPHLIAVINAAALATLLLGRQAIRRGEVRAHRRYMLAAAALISAFLILYVTRVALGGAKAFPGPAAVRVYVYLPMLAVHVLLSIVSVPLVIHNLLIGLTRPPALVGATAHPPVGRVAVALWSLSLILGLGVYAMLYGVR